LTTPIIALAPKASPASSVAFEGQAVADVGRGVLVEVEVVRASMRGDLGGQRSRLLSGERAL
jgi:hypothetical protein